VGDRVRVRQCQNPWLQYRGHPHDQLRQTFNSVVNRGYGLGIPVCEPDQEAQGDTAKNP